jgi:PAS domain-containing protein
VTEFKRRENDLRVQFELFEQALNHMSHGLCAIDSEHRIVLFNARSSKCTVSRPT